MSFRPGHVGVVGGGTSAWLTALALKEWRPELDVTVLPFAGPEGAVMDDGAVSGAVVTRPTALAFLHGYLGLEVHAFHREVRPLWHLGTRYAWGRPDSRYDFDLAFGEGNVAEALANDGGLWRWSLTAQLMAAGKAPLARLGGEVHTLLPKTPLGYLLERDAYVAYLAARAAKLGVRLEGRSVVDVRVEGDAVTGLTLGDDQAAAFDLYVDASGPRALLLEALGVPWEASALPCDAVVTGVAPHAGQPRPHTTLATREAGYLWSAPTRERVHHAFVYVADALSAGDAERALRAAVPGIGEVRRAPLSLGRRRELARGNVVAVGTSFGRPDPLLVADGQLEILHISRLLTLLTSGGAELSRANAHVAERWDAAQDLAALHYAMNRRAETPFWVAARQICDAAGSDPRNSHFAAPPQVAELRDRGLLSAREDAQDDGLYGLHGLDVLLTGLGVRPAGLRSGVTPEEWASLAEMRSRVVSAALSPEEAHAATVTDRALLEDLIFAEDGWCAPLVARMERAAPTRGRSRAALSRWTADNEIQALFPSDYGRGEPRYPESPVIDFGKFLRRVPAVVLRPRDQDQLAECMTSLYRRGIPFKVRGTGHSNGGQTLIDDGAVIDTRWLRRVVADDPEGQTLTIEGGCWMEEAQTWLHRQGRGRWLTNLLMHWRVTMAGSLAVGGFGDTSHYRGTQLEMVERMVVMTPDGVRHEVGRGDPLFDYSLGGRGQLGVMAEVTLKTEVRPGRVVARVVRWPTLSAFLEDAVTIIGERRFDILRGRINWEAATVDGAVGAFRERERGDEQRWMSDLQGKPTPRIENIDYYTENMKPPSAHWLPATPAVEFALPFDPTDLPAALAMMAELRDKILGGGLAPYTPLGTSFMVLPTVDTLPLAPVPRTTPLAIMIALRPEMPAEEVPKALPVVRDIGHWALARGGKLYLMCVEPETPDFLERQLGEHLAPLRALKRQHDPAGLLNPGLL